MARIRTIKPEFPQSESMGRVSRDARLLFVMLWPICDDHGRTRASSRMLASLLFPYDDDAPSLISGWLAELVREGCVRLYAHEGSSYLEVCNWLKHQKIDKPSKPAFPAFGESSRDLANTLEHSSLDLDQGSRIKEGNGEISTTVAKPKPKAKKSSKARLPPDFTLSDRVIAWAAENGVSGLAQHFDHFVGCAAAKGYEYVDWDAALMNAIRSNWAKLPVQVNGAAYVAGGGRRAL